MFRCIIFTQLYPLLSPDHAQSKTFDPVHQTSIDEGTTAENAMTLATVCITHANTPLGSRLTFQPSTGRVFLDGQVCGVVFSIKS